MKRAAGFTLIELMVTIGLAAVLLTIGLPGMREFFLNNSRTSVTNDLIASLQQARSEAVKRNKAVVLCPSSDQASCNVANWESGWIAFVDEDEDFAVDAPDEDIFLVQNALESQTLRSSFGSIQYSSGGRPGTNLGDDEAEFVICDERGITDARMVLVFRSGRTQASQTDLLNAAPGSCTP